MPYSENHVVRRRLEAFHDDQVVVDLKDEGLLRRMLDALNIRVVETERSEELGLTLLTLVAFEDAMEGLAPEQIPDERTKPGDPALAHTLHEELTPLDILLHHLRDLTAADHQGWKLRIAKNRVYENIEGSPYSGGAIGEPRPVEPFELPPRRNVLKPRIRVGIIDTPLYPHEGLAGRYVVAAEGLLRDRTSPRVSYGGHCLLACSIAAQLAPDAEFIIRPVLDEYTLTTTSWELAKSIIQSRNDNVDILLLALGGTTADGIEPLVLARACERTPDMIKVAALGNSRRPEDLPAGAGTPHEDERKHPALEPTLPMWPAASPTVIAVGADHDYGQVAFFSPTLDQAPWTDCYAPGVGRRGLFLPDKVNLVQMDYEKGAVVERGQSASFGTPGFAEWDGTSFAAAHVAGYLARKAQGLRTTAPVAADQLLRGVYASELRDHGIRVVRQLP
ncbi:S8/S53 family peptidase [Acrocarpospora sp. B8E8]|uniref:S8 family peptidase n=1 Tax=Acrocarpospora sp. B8E8 TaxID=3153572 RepID=UPI00325CF82E